MNGEGCDYDSILAEQAITKKTINNFLKNRPDKDSHKIQELLAKTGIGTFNKLCTAPLNVSDPSIIK